MNATWAGVQKQWGNTPSSPATSIWNSPSVTMPPQQHQIYHHPHHHQHAQFQQSGVPERSYLEPDQPSRQYRSLSYAAPAGTEQARISEAFRAMMAEHPLPESLDVSEMTEEEYLALPKSRSRSKSSSAIYGFEPEDVSASYTSTTGISPSLNTATSNTHDQYTQGTPDISAIWRDPGPGSRHLMPGGIDPVTHRRASTQPSSQMLMWEAMRSSHLATPDDMNGVKTDELMQRYRQQQHAAQMRRFSVAPSIVNRFVNSNVDVPEENGATLGVPHVYDASRRRHSFGGATYDHRLGTQFVTDGLMTMGINEQIEEIDDYFENTENRTRAWAEAGKNLQMNHAPPSPTPAMSPVSRHTFNFPLYVVEFKAGRIDYFYIADDSVGQITVGDLAIVEADRGKDLGKVIETNINSQQELQLYQSTHPDALMDSHGKEVHPKRIFRLAQPQEIAMLLSKGQDEAKAMGVCQVKIRQKKLPMEIVDAEYQWDRRKLTFYFVADRRVDFRELVRELFKIYKTRIW
eukprot:jgi/Hompol1/4578/HPOL_003723-RA